MVAADAAVSCLRLSIPGAAHRISKRRRVGEGRPSKRTPEVVAKIAEAVAIGLTDEEASLNRLRERLEKRAP